MGGLEDVRQVFDVQVDAETRVELPVHDQRRLRVEHSAAGEAATALARENLRRLRLMARTKVWIAPVSRALRLLSHRGESFDLIFLDPPYEQHLVEKSLKIIAHAGLLRQDGVLIVEHSLREQVEPHYDTLVLSDQRRYGTTLLSFFRQEANNDPTK